MGKKAVEKELQIWLKGPLDSSTKQEIENHKNDASFLEENFAHPLDFGTGGVRAKMGPGPSLLNIYTIKMLTQGLANYLQKVQVDHPTKRVIICYDTRKNSLAFARTTAEVLSANGIEAYLFTKPRPTPYLSFAIPHFHGIAGIMITASHNPPEYNGYKVFWKEGGQVVHPHDRAIIEEVRKVDRLSKVKNASNPALITSIKEDFDEIYLEAIHSLQFTLREKKDLQIVYTPLHGTGLELTPRALSMWGYKKLSLVKEQATQDGTFSYAPFPNPEENNTLALGAKQMIEENGDILIATDPDSDRVGVVIRDKNDAIRFTGNQIASLLLHFILTKNPSLPTNSAFVKSIVTTELFPTICKKFGYPCFEVLTGFKYIAEKINQWEKDHRHTFIFGAEESCGYLFHSLSRDKDGVLSSCLIAEMAEAAKKEKKTLLDKLYDLYQEFGIFREGLQSQKIKELSTMKSKMEKMRSSPPKDFSGIKVTIIEDYLRGKRYNLSSKEEENLFFPSSNVLLYWLEDNSKVVVRPSGTEPKVKFYVGVSSSLTTNIEKEKNELDEKVFSLLQSASQFFS